jgi:hypothetical protein
LLIYRVYGIWWTFLSLNKQKKKVLNQIIVKDLLVKVLLLNLYLYWISVFFYKSTSSSMKPFMERLALFYLVILQVILIIQNQKYFR